MLEPNAPRANYALKLTAFREDQMTDSPAVATPTDEAIAALPDKTLMVMEFMF